jgi:nucleotide-binding universal stress UspA family protein
MKKILVPCDFSETARQAYKFALDIASQNGGAIIVLKIIDLIPKYIESLDSNPFYASSGSVLAELKAEAEKDFEKLDKAVNTKNVPVKFVVSQGTVSQTILKEIHSQSADMVVMGTKGASGLKELLVGSNTEKIVRVAPVPVFAIHRATQVARIKNIVFPTNMDLTQSKLIQKIKALQTFFKATLRVLYVKTPSERATDSEMKISLENYAKFYGLENFSVHITHETNEQAGILKFAARTGNSIVAMATSGHTGLTHYMVGSIAEDVVNHAHEPVWTYSCRANG